MCKPPPKKQHSSGVTGFYKYFKEMRDKPASQPPIDRV